MSLRNDADRKRSLLRALRRGSWIEMTDQGWRVFHKNGARGHIVKVGIFADFAESGLIERTDDRTTRVGETWRLKAESAADKGDPT